ncbi:hypothetical protein [Thermoflexibacter ruber]|uniref:DnaJ domain-containing protein n=1 Tax=Thermoflexibacter ruber TaxID=1003 RepID=A0A1I2JA49_9BACT|nr:hypothetical protein [Thermoflexibacter ruber]SFF51394.1 hypothetical protein SAMN04488541_104522 [Thermoflexibacter ruber]
MPRKKATSTTPSQLENNVDVNQSSVPVIGKSKEKILSKHEADFNKKIKRIESLKKEITSIKEQIANIRLRVVSDIFPLREKIKEKQKKYVLILDKAYESGFFKKRDSETLIQHILELCEHILAKPEFVDEEKITEDEQVEQLKEKYETLMFTQEEKEIIDDTAKEIIRTMFGIDIDLDEMRKNPQAYFQKKQQEMEEGQQDAWGNRQGNRKKTKKQIEKEQQQAEEKKLLSKDIRTIYTSLAKELHPDLEQDEAERHRKTEMMKRVTAAYEANDLFELLRLQLEYQIQHEHIESLMEDQLKRYNQLLQEQIRELENERFSIIGWGSPTGMIYEKYCRPTPQATDRIFKQEKTELQHIIDSLQDSINAHTDYKILKEFLKELRQEYKQREKEFPFGGFVNF